MKEQGGEQQIELCDVYSLAEYLASLAFLDDILQLLFQVCVGRAGQVGLAQVLGLMNILDAQEVQTRWVLANGFGAFPYKLCKRCDRADLGDVDGTAWRDVSPIGS